MVSHDQNCNAGSHFDCHDQKCHAVLSFNHLVLTSGMVPLMRTLVLHDDSAVPMISHDQK